MQYLTLRIALQRCGTHSRHWRPEARNQCLVRLLAKDCHRRQRFPPSSPLCKFFYPRWMIFDLNDTDSGAYAADQRDLELIIRVWDELCALEYAYLMPRIPTIAAKNTRWSAFERKPRALLISARANRNERRLGNHHRVGKRVSYVRAQNSMTSKTLCVHQPGHLCNIGFRQVQ